MTPPRHTAVDSHGVPLTDLIAGLSLQAISPAAGVTVFELWDDSRDATPGSLYIDRGVVGDEAARRRYIDAAIAQGAVAVISALAPTRDINVAWLQAGDGVAVDQALAGALAERFFGRPSERLTLIGITGTNGKTTTAMLIQHLLQAQGVACGLIGTVLIDDGKQRTEASLTTPGAIAFSRMLAAMVANGCAAAVAEMSSHGLHQGRTAALAIDVGVFTNLSGDHLDYHGNMDSYAAAKALLFTQLPRRGVAVINADDPYAEQMITGSQVAAAGGVRRCSVRDADEEAAVEERGGVNSHDIAKVHALAADHCDVTFTVGAMESRIRLPLVGRHNIANALHAATTADAVMSKGQTSEADRAPSHDLASLLSDLPSVPGRLEPVRVDDGASHPAVLVDYAHTDDALKNVLDALREVMPTAAEGGGELICVFGCGGDRDATKRPRMAEVACRLANRVVITSDNPRTEDPKAILADIQTGVPGADAKPPSLKSVDVIEDRRAAIQHAITNAKANDVVLIAGKGHEDYQIMGVTKHPFDDRVEAAAALRDLSAM